MQTKLIILFLVLVAVLFLFQMYSGTEDTELVVFSALGFLIGAVFGVLARDWSREAQHRGEATLQKGKIVHYGQVKAKLLEDVPVEVVVEKRESKR